MAPTERTVDDGRTRNVAREPVRASDAEQRPQAMAALRIGDAPLTPGVIAAAARRGPLSVELTTGARERMATARAVLDRAAARRAVYGRTTGVGANCEVVVEDDRRGHALRLLRSHAGGVGEPLPEEVVRGTILVRLSQMAGGGGGHRPQVASALVSLLQADALPELQDLGGLGTGDLSVLAQLGLALVDDRGFALAEGDALPFISSNAATLAVAALAWTDLRELLDAGLGVAATTFRAVDGNVQAYAAPVAAARPLPGLVAVAGRLRALTDGAGPPARLQDPYGLRCLPPVGGALLDALDHLYDVLSVEVVAAAENPLVAGDEVLHHGGFHGAPVALALDTVRLALVAFCQLAVARLSHLMEPRLTGLSPFLAAPAPGSSGVMIAEYLAADALARLRVEAAPVVPLSAVISRGKEEHASFAWQGALQARRAVEHARTVLALEHLAAGRALAMKRGEPAPEDRPLGEDAARAAAALAGVAGEVRRST
ncbi:MAG: aromatic amino acid lyase [Thermoleophilaceae bacterium]